MMSLWVNEHGEWAVCDGPGPTEVAGYLVEAAGGGWAIKGDPLHRRFLDQESAAATELGQPLPKFPYEPLGVCPVLKAHHKIISVTDDHHVALRDFLEGGAGIGDGDKVAARLIRANGVLHLIEKELLENIRFKSRAGFAGHDNERIGKIDLVAGGEDLLRIGGIDNVQRGKAGALAESER